VGGRLRSVLRGTIYHLSASASPPSFPVHPFTELVLARPSEKMLNGSGIKIFTGASAPCGIQ
jgi:hypothetical protein